jgi:hypothetical protein
MKHNCQNMMLEICSIRRAKIKLMNEMRVFYDHSLHDRRGGSLLISLSCEKENHELIYEKTAQYSGHMTVSTNPQIITTCSIGAICFILQYYL